MAFFDFMPESFGNMFRSAEPAYGSLAREAAPAMNFEIPQLSSNMQVPTDILRSSYSPTPRLNVGDAMESLPEKAAEPGFMDRIGQYVGPAANALGAASMIGQIPLGLMSLGVAKQGQQALQQGVSTEERMAAPAIAAEEQLYPAGTKALMSGQLPPQLETQVNNQVNQYEQSMLQNLVSQGINPDTARAMISGQVEQMRNQLTMQAAQSLLGGGSEAAQTAGSGGFMGGQLGTTEYGTASNVLGNSQRALNQLLA